MKLLPGGFNQLLPIVQWFVELQYEHIEEAALGTLAPETDAPSEEEALECLLRIFEERQEESDRETLEAYMGARAWEWWTDYPECQLLTTLVQRADRRKKWLGTKDDKRRPWHEEGLRIARPLLAGIPDKINLDPEGEYEAMANVLAALLSPPMGESSPETLQRYIKLAKSHPVYSDALKRYIEELDDPVKTIPRPEIRWHPRVPGRRRVRHYAKTIVQPHPPVKPALLLRNLHIQFVIGLLQRVQVPPRGKYVSGCRIVACVLVGLSEYTVKDIWKMRFTHEMRKHSEAIAERIGLPDTTEA